MIVNIIIPPEPILISIEDAICILPIKERKLREMVARDEIPHKHVGGRIAFQPERLREWAGEH